MRTVDQGEAQGIAERLKGKDEKALEELMDAYETEVFRIVQKIVKNILPKEDIQEIVNDAFFQVWKHADTLDEKKGSVRTYLAATARNLAKNRLRNHQGGVFLVQDYDVVEVADVFDTIEQEERKRIVREALEQLSGEEKEIFIRYYYLYETTVEIAARLGLNGNTVKSKLKRGRKKLQAFLKERRIEA
ncbi:MAG TPA: sigma-70 family RNA polymerase sigma factor [Candidatus Mediterraneibacter merdavium]|nr:sigma-70 family RNA polymerase sigma factor [Candidatus Mediterraneibacter merdavium]